MSFLSKIYNFKKSLETPFETMNNIYISKEAILNNYEVFKKLNPTWSIFPVLKSNAYGHGIKEVAKILKSVKLDYIVADSYFEALKIHEVNSTPVLLIGYTLPINLKNIDFTKVSLVVYDLVTIQELADIGRKVKVHLKIDTGMHRQGIYYEELPKFIEIIKASPNIVLEGVCTHFADSDSTINSYSLFQVGEFQKSVVFLKSRGFKLKYIHSNNSAGATKNFCQTTCNSMRLGISLYGVNPLEKNDESYNKLSNLKLALTFESILIQIKQIRAGDKVSYNGTFEAKEDMIIGIVPVGYYEALSRKLSNNYSYNYLGYSLPIIGRICMNLTVIDLTGINIKVGDKVEIISTKASNNIYELASKSETITYECFTRLAESIRRKVI
ncbi:MAG: alanine racemase [Candidatus Gracilibacteria bacterium]|nr:alanine racemase [Candidatus Gracilibacteria bacterium]MDD2908682.1 alanine racemase [Candidatus Gracilibacteria bacterium]